MSEIIWFDIITLALILILGIKGIINGFVKEVFGLLGIVGGVMLASRNAESAANFISSNLYSFQSSSISYLVGFLTILFVVWISCLMLGMFVSKLVKLSGMSMVDRLAGLFTGSAKIFLIFAVLVAVITNIEFIKVKIQPFVQNSFMYPLLLSAGKVIIKIDPNKIKKQISYNTTDEKQKNKKDVK